MSSSAPSMASITPDTAPREVDKLANVGRFQLRRLAELLNLVDTEQKKSAFMSAQPIEMAQAISAALKLRDGRAANGTTSVEVATPVAAPVATATVTPQAAPVQEQAPVEAPKRTPRTNSNGVTAAPVQTASVDLTEVLSLLRSNQSELAALNKQVAVLNNLSAELAFVKQIVLSGLEIGKLNTALATLLGEADPNINLSQYNVLKEGMRTQTEVERLIEQATKELMATKGKA